MIIFLVLVGACLGGWRWGPAVWRQGVLLYWQHRCFKYEVRPDVVLYEPDPTKAAALLAQQDTDYVPMTLYLQNGLRVKPALFYPRCLREFESRTSKTYAAKDSSIVYLHERRTPAGKRRMVVVYTRPWDDSGILWEWAVYEPAGIFEPKLLNSGIDQVGLRTGMMSGFYIPKRLGPGQSDPADETHFTFPRLVNGQRVAWYDGRLTDEDKVMIALQTGAANR